MLARRLALLLPIVALLVLALAPGTASAKPNASAANRSCIGADLRPTAANLNRISSATRCLINVERRRRGLRPLRANAHLTRAAQRYSRQMVRESFFGHVSPSGTTMTGRIKSGTAYLARARRYVLGENIAWGAGARATPRRTMVAWMNSRGHRLNILDRSFTQLGIGVVKGAPADVGAKPAATYTTEFGHRR